MTNETMPESNPKNWKAFLRKHWKVAAIFVVAAILAFAGAIYVFLWFVGQAQAISLVPATLGSWTMENIVTFILHLVFWELLFIGIPVAIGGIAGWQWWRRLPEAEKNEYHFGKRSKSAGGGGGVSVLLMVAFAIKVYIDGKWSIAIASWSLNYVVDSMISIILWGLIIFGIPAGIIGLIWLSRELKKES